MTVYTVVGVGGDVCPHRQSIENNNQQKKFKKYVEMVESRSTQIRALETNNRQNACYIQSNRVSKKEYVGMHFICHYPYCSSLFILPSLLITPSASTRGKVFLSLSLLSSSTQNHQIWHLHLGVLASDQQNEGLTTSEKVTKSEGPKRYKHIKHNLTIMSPYGHELGKAQ